MRLHDGTQQHHSDHQTQDEIGPFLCVAMGEAEIAISI
ncbi:hypothetical protein GGR66_004094 [Xanthomonas sp. 3498]|nr:hypothetical protein [Xanthomonas sp. 3498]